MSDRLVGSVIVGGLVGALLLAAACGADSSDTPQNEADIITIDWRGQKCDLAIVQRGAGTGLTTLGCYAP